MSDIDDIMSGFSGKPPKNNEPEYEKTKEQKWAETKKMVNDFYDWFSLPLNLLIGAILLAGAILMYMSLMLMTNNPVVSILLISISEAGILGWEFAHERTKNTETQSEVSQFMRNWHIATSIILLVTNIIVETITQTLSTLSIKVDGLVYIIFAVIGITALFDLINFFKYKDNDRETSNKKKFDSRLQKLAAETKELQMNAFAEAERIKSEALVQYWKENSGTLAEISGKIDAAKQIKDKFKSSGLSEDEIDAVMQKISRNSNKRIETIEHQPEPEQPKQKRPYNRKQLNQPEPEENNNSNPIPAPELFSKKEEIEDPNFTDGTQKTDLEGWV